MPTVYVFEEAAGHLQRGHPEHPSRLSRLRARLPEIGAQEIESRLATGAEIHRVHTAEFTKSLEVECGRGETIIDFAPTYVNQTSYEAALRAAGGMLECVSHVLAGEARNAFAIVRPPGHHAEPDRAMGFCLFNNVAVAAAAALESGLERVAIVDYDAHHGNGTQAAFVNDPRVAYLSTHQWGIYPGTGWYEEAPHARSRIVNMPLPARSGDLTYSRVMQEIALPILHRFRPELILVSAGFDAHWSDPITDLGLSTAGFHHLSRRLVECADQLCQGRIVFVLEGGYDPTNVANGVGAVLAALMGRAPTDAGDACPHEEPRVGEHLAAIRSLHGI